MVESQLHELNDLPEWASTPVDEWLAIENDELRQQLEDMELTVRIEHDIMIEAVEDRDTAIDRLAKYKQKWSEGHKEENQHLTKRLMTLSNIILEYEQVLNQYVSATSTKLTNDNLERLLKEGGFKV